MQLDKERIQLIQTVLLGAGCLALVGIFVYLLWYPAGKEYLTCEKDKPLIGQYEACLANISKGYIPTFSCVAPYTSTNWSTLGKNATDLR